MNNMYAMQRANGDWFAFAERGDWRVPLFRSSGNAMSARMHNAGMLLFKPVAIDERAISEMAFNDNNRAVHFWLVDSPSTDVNRGHFIDHTQLARLVSTTKEQALLDVEV